MEKQNRAERRKGKFGRGRATEHGGWPTVRPNPVFTGDTAADDAPKSTPDTDPAAGQAPDNQDPDASDAKV
ncbi:MAG TPA: hypothetical protein VHM48_04215 [Candidatus Limnocylindrales bacterium]|nr:hypothetical protein [Candidatus Limnocylindrales bacterium]